MPLLVSSYLLAAHANLSVRAIETLLHGRDGRSPARRIHVEVARAVITVWPETILAADSEQVSAGPSRELLSAIRGLGWTDPDLVRASSSGQLELRARDLRLDEPWCSRGTAARLQATYDQLTTDRICPPVYPAVNRSGVECRGPLSAA